MRWRPLSSPLRGLRTRPESSSRIPATGRLVSPLNNIAKEGTYVSTITIYHNPRCGTSRNTLAAIRDSGVEPVVIEYLKTPPSRAELVGLIAASGLSVRKIMRRKEALFSELGLDDPQRSDEELIDAMVAHPILINRPIVVTPLGTRLCRPSEVVREILPKPGQGAGDKEPTGG